MKTISGFILWLFGWRVLGEAPELRRFVLVAAPHTSNWDLLWLLLMAWSKGISIRWLAKHTLFRGVQGWLLQRLGGVPVDRRQREDRVAATARLFRELDSLVLVIPPEATRVRTDYWKSGFFHIARLGGVAVVPSALDYARREGEIGPPLAADQGVTVLMDALRAFYAGRQGAYPDQFGPVRLPEEDAASDPQADQPTAA